MGVDTGGAMGAGYVGAGYRERAADFLGACLPLPGAGSSISKLSRLKVRRYRQSTRPCLAPLQADRGR